MPKNPSRSAQGGDVEGTKPIDTQWSVGDPIQVSAASYDPGYDFGASIDFVTKADLLQGYCDYGRSTGEPDDAFKYWNSHYRKGK